MKLLKNPLQKISATTTKSLIKSLKDFPNSLIKKNSILYNLIHFSLPLNPAMGYSRKNTNKGKISRGISMEFPKVPNK